MLFDFLGSLCFSQMDSGSLEYDRVLMLTAFKICLRWKNSEAWKEDVCQLKDGCFVWNLGP